MHSRPLYITTQTHTRITERDGLTKKPKSSSQSRKGAIDSIPQKAFNYPHLKISCPRLPEDRQAALTTILAFATKKISLQQLNVDSE